MPAASLQSRIKAFEKGQPITTGDDDRPLNDFKIDYAGEETFHKTSGPPTPSTPSHAALKASLHNPQVSLIDLRDWVIEDEPTYHKPPLQPNQLHTPVSPSFVGRTQTPLIVLDDAPLVPLPKVAPSLPPRKPSYSSLKSVSTTSSSHFTRIPSDVSLSHRVTDSLSPIGTSTYSPNGIPRSGHAQASSISSFHSVSLSDGGDNPTMTTPTSLSTFAGMRREGDEESLDESFETVSTTSSAPPFEWPVSNHGFRLRGPPASAEARQVPPIPSKPPGMIAASTPTGPLPYVPRRPPPVPPRVKPTASSGPLSSRASVTSASDRSSIFSVATATTSRTSTSGHETNGKASPLPTPRLALASLNRPTPVPAAARARYEAVFAANVGARQRADLEAAREMSRNKARKTGWRGLSVDLITNIEESNLQSAPSSPIIGAETTLSAQQIRAVWSASGLDRTKLRSIWSECDPASVGRLTCEAFIKGMWRIDEELRRAQAARRVTTTGQRM